MLTFDIKNTELIIDDIYKDIKRCRICGAYSDQLGYLYRCIKDKFCSSHWDQKKLREDFIFLFKKRSFHKNKKLISEAVTLILHNSKVKPAESKAFTSCVYLTVILTITQTFLNLRVMWE